MRVWYDIDTLYNLERERGREREHSKYINNNCAPFCSES